MPMPQMDDESRKRPISYDPEHGTFISFDDVVSGKQKIVPLDALSNDDLKTLVIERWRVLPEDTTVRAISGKPLSRDDVIRAIEKGEPFGQITLEAEKSYLRDLLNEIEQNLK